MAAPRIDFYLLTTSEKSDKLLLACRLLEKACARKHRVFVYCSNRQDAEELDELLWAFKDDSFIPHNLQGEGLEPPPPVQIGHEPPSKDFHDILLNLSDGIPDFFNRFRRIMELVINDETAKEISRNHFREYRKNRCELHTHPIDFAGQSASE